MRAYLKSNRNIIISFVIVMFLVLGLGIISIFKISELSSLTKKFHDHPLVVITSTYKIQLHLVSIHRYMKDVVLSDTKEKLALAIQRVNADDKAIIKEFDIISAQYLGNKEEIKTTFDLFIAWREIRKDVIGLMHQNKQKQAIKMNQNRAYEHANKVINSSQVLTKFAQNKANNFTKDAKNTKELAILVIVGIIIIILALIIALLIVLLMSIKNAENLKAKQQKELLQHTRLVQMGEMMSMIAHQWRQPLTSISAIAGTLSIDVIMDEYKKDYFEEKLQSINEISQHLSSTIDDFRDFYKPEKKKVTIKLEEIIRKSLNLIRTSLLNDNIEIIEEYNSKDKIELYDNELVQVILNILKNAQDNFKEKHIENPYIKITTDNTIISISDNGGGILENILENIFDPYFTTKDEKNGTGLGLYMSKTIIEEHHKGKLSVQNTDDGVCFKIECERNCE